VRDDRAVTNHGESRADDLVERRLAGDPFCADAVQGNVKCVKVTDRFGRLTQPGVSLCNLASFNDDQPNGTN
jgi:hypothetical protein